MAAGVMDDEEDLNVLLEGSLSPVAALRVAVLEVCREDSNPLLLPHFPLLFSLHSLHRLRPGAGVRLQFSFFPFRLLFADLGRIGTVEVAL